METNKETRNVLIDWYEEKAEEIRKDTIESIDSAIEHATMKLDISIKSLRKQAEALDVLLPLNLIEMIAKGGCVLSEEVHVPGGWYWSATVGDRKLYYEDSQYGRFQLKQGRYRFTFIVEKLIEEE